MTQPVGRPAATRQDPRRCSACRAPWRPPTSATPCGPGWPSGSRGRAAPRRQGPPHHLVRRPVGRGRRQARRRAGFRDDAPSPGRGVGQPTALYYKDPDQVSDRGDDINRIAGWLNVALTAERITQGSPRSFVRYTVPRLRLARGARAGSGDTLDLTLRPVPAVVSPHPVDDFIDPSLGHRVQVDLGRRGLSPSRCATRRAGPWTAPCRLSDEGESSEATAATVAGLRDEYTQMTEDALALEPPERGPVRRPADREGAPPGARAGDSCARSSAPPGAVRGLARPVPSRGSCSACGRDRWAK